MELTELLRSGFEPRVRERGERDVREGRIAQLRISEHAIEAVVRHSESEEHFARIVAEPSGSAPILQMSCDCAQFDRFTRCKHLWSALRAAQERGVSLAPYGFAEGPAAHDTGWLRGRYVFSRTADQRERYTHEVSIARLTTDGDEARPLVQPLWKTVLGEIERVDLLGASHDAGERETESGALMRIVYRLDLTQSQVRDKLVISLFQRSVRQDGTLGVLRRLQLDRDEFEHVGSDDDHAILALLRSGSLERRAQQLYGAGYERYDQVIVTPALYDVLLPKLAATERFELLRDPNATVVDAPVLAWDGASPWRLALELKDSGTGDYWLLSGQLERGGQVMPLAGADLVLSSGLVVVENRVAPLEAARSAARWIKTLRKVGAVAIAKGEADDFFAHLWPALAELSIDLPNDIGWERAAGKPVPVLRVDRMPALDEDAPPDGEAAAAERGNIGAHVAFAYDGQVVPAGQRGRMVVDRDARRVLERDPDAERRAIEQLVSAGARSVGGATSAWFTIPSRRLLSAVQHVLADGWQVDIGGAAVRRTGKLRARVHSGVDWFDLDARLQFEGGEIALPELLEAARMNRRWVRLPDGSLGVLDSETLARYGTLALFGELENGMLRFEHTHTALLDVLVAALPEVETDAAFEAARARLNAFDGIHPKPAPAEFKGELRHYQEYGLAWFDFLRSFGFGGCLADDMGLGKTIQILALLTERKLRKLERGEKHLPTLVVVPRSLVFNWIREAQRFAPQLRFLEYAGRGRAERLSEAAGAYDVIIMTYGLLRSDITKLRTIEFDYAILDEAQAIKNSQAQVTKAARLIRAKHRLALTGTPVENHLGELASIFEFLNPGMLRRIDALDLLSRGAQGDGGLNASQEALGVLSRALRPFILRRTKREVLQELPEKTEGTIWCDLETQERKRYEELKHHVRAQLDRKINEVGLGRAKIHVLEALLRLRQAACHGGLIDPELSAETSSKLEAVLEKLVELRESRHKALVFSQFTSFLGILREHLERQGIPYEYLDGRTRNREAAVERFQTDPDCGVFLISLRAGGHGLNLTAAEYVFLLDPWWNPAVEAQAIDRTHRIGQTNPVFAYRLIARDTVEEKILQLQDQKKDLAEAIFTENRSLMRSLTRDDLELLLS